MPQELTIESAPRDPRALLSLDDKQRKHLFKQLCEDAGEKLHPGIRAFGQLHPLAQVHCLLTHLIEYDKATAGYTVLSASLPMRSTRHATNDKRMESFAQELEDQLNRLRDSGHHNISTFQFSDHGVVIVGYKPPPQLEIMPMGVPLPAEVQQALQQAVRQHTDSPHVDHLVRLVFEKKSLQGMVTQDDVEEIVKEETKRFDAETLGKVLSGLEDRMREHLNAHQSDDHGECEVVAELKKQHTAIEKRLNRQCN